MSGPPLDKQSASRPVRKLGLSSPRRGCIVYSQSDGDLLPLPSCSEECRGESWFYRVLSLVDEPNLELVMIN